MVNSGGACGKMEGLVHEAQGKAVLHPEDKVLVFFTLGYIVRLRCVSMTLPFLLLGKHTSSSSHKQRVSV